MRENKLPEEKTSFIVFDLLLVMIYVGWIAIAM